ncbi:HNH endonuclease signature motif containing protein [Pseudomonas crudilactis]|uniref:HNH endonuclease signature motif containing protein n=1 Tax=Pseudomonas crudilactis TaxID=2697028 RepID=UPI001240213C|nr:hypothetical protein PS681_00507 [Pseudomonas fluorescens]VVN50342.1 hypothetical protein PS684_00264 [Pseudomonas fluorescens]
MTITNSEIKKLYGLAAGRCSICKLNVFLNDVHIGEMAHIIAKSTNGTRGGEELSHGRNSYENLILLCANHHTEVDQNPQRYPVNELNRIKSEHERVAASVFESPRERQNDVDFLSLFMRFVPFTRLRYFTDGLPISVSLNLCAVGDTFDALLIDNPHLYPLNDSGLQTRFDSFIKSYYALWSLIAGFTKVDGRHQAHFSQANDRGDLHMEKRHLPYAEVVKLSKKINTRNHEFIAEHAGLIDFIRKNFKEVDLDSYEPYKI